MHYHLSAAFSPFSGLHQRYIEADSNESAVLAAIRWAMYTLEHRFGEGCHPSVSEVIVKRILGYARPGEDGNIPQTSQFMFLWHPDHKPLGDYALDIDEGLAKGLCWDNISQRMEAPRVKQT